jgi:LCP family protein required for cell wall assembly
MAANGDRDQQDRPEYKVYRSRPGFLSRVRAPDLGALRKKGGGKGRPPRDSKRSDAHDRPGPPWRRILKWVGIGALVWIAISIVAFLVSAQIQKGKLADNVGDVLDGNPFMAVNPQTILVLGTDVRSGQFAGPAEAETKRCIETIESGRSTGPGCRHAPYRSDTIMLIRAGAGTFRKLSIPRDTLAEIPGQGAQKINAAYAFGGAKLTIETIEQFLGLNIDEVAIVDFDGFRKFIDEIGGVEVDLPTDVCSSVSGGAFGLNLDAGEHTLNGYQAITLARTRENTCGSGDFTGTDIERAQFQQLILDGIKSRLTDPLRLPYNLIKGPFIAWDAPQAMVSSMGAFTMPQLLFAAGIGGNDGTDVLEPSAPTPAGNLFVSKEECDRAVHRFLDGDPPRDPACSPTP